MEKAKIPVVVTLSGKIDIELEEGMTVREVKDLVVERWNIDESQTDHTFVVVSDMVTNASTLCQEDEVDLSDKVKKNGMLRVVLPLIPKE